MQRYSMLCILLLLLFHFSCIAITLIILQWHFSCLHEYEHHMQIRFNHIKPWYFPIIVRTTVIFLILIHPPQFPSSNSSSLGLGNPHPHPTSPIPFILFLVTSCWQSSSSFVPALSHSRLLSNIYSIPCQPTFSLPFPSCKWKKAIASALSFH